MSSDPVPSLALPAPASTATATAPASTLTAPQLAKAASTEQQQQPPPPATPQKPTQMAQQQHVTANHPASIAAAATVALSATLLDPNEWNALASTSMVTLDDLRTAFLEQRQQQLKDLERTHRESLREMLFMSESFDKADVAGSPWKLGQSMEVAEDDSRQDVKAFLTNHRLSLDNQTSIKDYVLEQPKAIREIVSRELKTGPVELAPPPTPTSATAPSAADSQRDRDRQKELEQSNKAASHRSQAVARAAAAVQARAIAEGVAKIKPLTITAAESQGVRVAPLQPGQVPSFVIESTTPIAPIVHGAGPSTASAVEPSAAKTDLPTASSGDVNAESATPAVKVESPGKTDSSPSKAPNALDKAVSPVPGLARNATAQSAGLRIPPSPMVVPTIPDIIAAPPLHPTLQVLAPNPLSVTYAASLRPLPPDPTRRITGVGVGGGAIHHRSGRKISSLSNHSNVNSYSSIAAAKIGPAGSGQADLYRWYVRARASPGAGMVGKADKCLMTSDWKVAFNEQRFVRAMARIEKLKAQGEWSFRQPKKQKGPVVRKAHWDHLLEEMKWLQTDFREERRWKMTVAFHLAHEVAAWHRARTAAERAAFCVSVQRPYRRRTVSDNVEQQPSTQDSTDDVGRSTAEHEAAMEAEADEEMPEIAPSKRVQDDGPSASDSKTEAAVVKACDDGDVTMEGDEDADAAVTKAVEDALETTNEAASARAEEMDADGEDDDVDADADDVEAATAALVSGEPAKPPQVEVVREPLAQPEPMPTLSAGSQPTATSATPADLANKEAQTSDGKLTNALRPEPKDAESTLTAELPPQLLATLRAPIFSTNVTTTVVSPAALLESLDPEAAAALLGIEVGDLSNAADLLEPGSLSFSKMFPELPLYGGVSLPDPSSKSDRRWDEGSLNQPPRLTHVTKLLDSRPLLVSTLEPSKNRANGRWLPDSDWVVAAEQSDPLRGVTDGADAGLPPMPGSLLFARKSNRAAKETNNPASTNPAEPAQPGARAALFMWTPDEDNYLMTLAKQYHNNWSLVADLFNSTRLNTATDKREPWDCYDRCRRIQQAAEEGKPPPGPPQLPPAAAEADKDKDKKGDGKDAGDASASKRDKLSKKLGSKYDGSKRKLRRSNLMEVMRKSAKRREASKQAQQTQQTKKVNLNTHETHAQIKAGPAITPQSLSALKAERDQAALRQYYEQQRAQLAYQQQQQQQQRLLAQQAQAQRMAQQQAAGATPGQAVTTATQPGKPVVAASVAGAGGPAALTLPPGSTPGIQPGQAAQAQQKVVPGQGPAQQAPQQQQQPQQAQPQQAAQTQQQQPAQQQQQQQVQAQLQSQFQASQAAQMQNLYAQIQQQQRQQQQQNQQLGQAAAGMGQVRPAVGPLTQQQLATLTPQQQQQYHAQLAAATAAAQQQQLRNQMAAVAAAQQGAQAGAGGVQGLPFQLPNAQAQAQFQLMQQQQQQQQQQQNAMQQQQQQQQQQNQPRPPNMQAQAQAAALQMYQQQQRQAAQVQAQAQMRPPAQQPPQQQQQQYGGVRPGGNTSLANRPPPVPTATGQKQSPQPPRPPTPSNGATGSTTGGNAAGSPSGMPATIQALQQQLAISLATSNLSPEQINGLAIQLYKQAQQQQSQGGQIRPTPPPSQQGATVARPPQQILNQAIQALAAQNQKNQQQQQQQQQQGAGVAAGAKQASGVGQPRPPTPRPS
ncbi:related to Chromatin modification-related protein EAF1 [Ustilago trichophora]|uniref:Vacuolar import and degradation protein 21 n=1 Tax=Ustilago trichophora TaxID=86804 RepID=A0A5C3EQP5_9BASI|nr:related to Chromatin modification-related protein EAF1 [Ustilago trichophora]